MRRNLKSAHQWQFSVVKLIVALGPNNLIGKSTNGMAWHVPAELAFFRQMTINHAVLFGGKTYRGLTRPLVKRQIYVFSSQPVLNAIKLSTKAEVLELFKQYQADPNRILWIAGGKQIYEQFYTYADEIYVSKVYVDAVGDVFLNWDLSAYKQRELQSNVEFSVFVYDKVKDPNG